MGVNKKKQIIIGIALAVIVVAVIFFGIKALMGGANDENETVYATSKVKKGDISVSVETKGQLQASYGGSIQVPGGGYYDGTTVNYVIQELYIEEGSQVSEGQVVATLVSTELDNQIKAKESELDALLQELSSMTGLPEDEVENINASKGVVLRAPIDGRINELNGIAGQELESGELVANIVDDSYYSFKTLVLPGELSGFTVGGTAKLNFESFEGFQDVTVKNINPSPISVEVKHTDKPSSWIYAHVMYLVGKNPGLVQKGMKAQVGAPLSDGKSVKMCSYSGEVDKFLGEEKVFNRATARISEIYVYNHQTVKAGDPIMALSGEKMQETVSAKQEQIRELRSRLMELRSEYGNMEIVSPINGVVSYLEAKVGATVQKGQWLGETYNTDQMMMLVQVDDIDIINIQVGATVQVTVDAIPGQTFEGEVTNISTRGNSSEGSGVTKYNVDIELQGGAGLRPGMQAKARIDSGEAKNVLLIPVEAVFSENGQEMVEILVDGMPKTVKIKTGLMNSRFAEVTEGLKKGQLVITGSSDDVLPSESIKADQGLLPADTGKDDAGGDGKDDDAKKTEEPKV